MKITDKEILQINRLYKEIGTYSGVAREIGCSPGTVKKYIVKDFDENAFKHAEHFDETKVPHITNIDHIKDIMNICDLCKGEQPRIDVIPLRKEILI